MVVVDDVMRVKNGVDVMRGNGGGVGVVDVVIVVKVMDDSIGN